MDTIDLLEYAVKGITYFSVGTFAFVGTKLLIETTLFRKKIKSQEELAHIVDVEARKLGLDPLKIDTTYNKNGVTADYSRKNGERYELHLGGDCYSNVATVRHELYHILKDCDRGEPTPLYYWFVAEPRATLYGQLGIKL